jgi:hypothetical protein
VDERRGVRIGSGKKRFVYGAAGGDGTDDDEFNELTA